MGSKENGEQENRERENGEPENQEPEEDEEENRKPERGEGENGRREIGEEPLSPRDARQVIAAEGGQVLDIRDRGEFSGGRIAGSLHSDEDEIDAHLEELSKDEPVVVVCSDGERSAAVAEKLREDGFEAASIDGGMRAWTSAKMPLQPRESEEFEGPGGS